MAVYSVGVVIAVVVFVMLLMMMMMVLMVMLMVHLQNSPLLAPSKLVLCKHSHLAAIKMWKMEVFISVECSP